MPDAHRDEWLAILEAVALNPASVENEGSNWLMRPLGMPLTHFPAVLNAIHQGRWRNAKNPIAYLGRPFPGDKR